MKNSVMKVAEVRPPETAKPIGWVIVAEANKRLKLVAR
jgi:hypothetical protein